MPNWCQNVATISHDNSELIDAIETELNKEKDDIALFQLLRPRPAEHEDDWYGWNTSNWGTKWDISYCSFERLDDNTIKLDFDTAWGPCVALYEYLETEGYTVEAFYNEEGMAFCGCYRDGYDDQYNYSDYYTSDGILGNVPNDIDDMFGISERLADNEAEEEESEEDEEPVYEMTEWFDVKTKPVHIGLYDIQYDKPNAWPFPSRLTWTGKKWLNAQDEERADVGKWRGLANKPRTEEEMLEALEELKVLFEKEMEGEK